MSDDQFTQLQIQIEQTSLRTFRHMNKRFDELDAKLETKANKSTVDLIHNQLDSFLKRTDTDETERAALTVQVDRHDGWINQLATKTGTKFSH